MTATSNKYSCSPDEHQAMIMRQWAARILTLLAISLGAALIWQGQKAVEMRKENESTRRELTRSLLRAQLIVLSSPHAIVTFTEDLEITMINPAAEHLLGWDSRQLVGQNLTILMPPDEQEKREKELQACILQLKQRKGSCWLLKRAEPGLHLVRQDGTEVAVSKTFRVIRYDDVFEFIALYQPDDASSENAQDLQILSLPDAELRDMQQKLKLIN